MKLFHNKLRSFLISKVRTEKKARIICSSLWLFCLPLIFSSCKLEEINENPNVPTDVPVNLLLPGAQANFANALGGRLFRYAGIASQQLQGKDNQELLMENYNPDELFVGYPWEDLYAGPMINLKLIIAKASEQNAPAYGGVAKILMANCIGVVTDIWGDVPFSAALSGGNNLTPVYDSQENIYTQIQTMLDEAIVLLEMESPVKPGLDDIIFQGDLNQWKKAAHALKARYYIHLSNVNSQAPQQALDEILLAGVESFQYSYSGGSIDTNPINNFFESTAYAVVDPQFIGVMGIDDPRFDYFIDIIPFSGGLSKVGIYKASPSSPIKFMSYEEQKFIEAEAYARLGNTTSAQAALVDALQYSLNDVEVFTGVDIADDEEMLWLNSMTLTGEMESDLEIILNQKYITLFAQQEPWNDWRRTNIPVLSPNSNGVSSVNPSGEIPRRLIYPQNERLLNPNMPLGLNMQSPVWWDQ